MELKTVFSLKSLLLCFFLLSLITSCKKDDKEEECVPPALSTHIVNTWQADISGLAKTQLTFTSSGEVQGNLAQFLALIPGAGPIDDLIKYEVAGDTSITVKATSDGEEISYPLAVQERTCDKIVLSIPGAVTITLTK